MRFEQSEICGEGLERLLTQPLCLRLGAAHEHFPGEDQVAAFKSRRQALSQLWTARMGRLSNAG